MKVSVGRGPLVIRVENVGEGVRSQEDGELAVVQDADGRSIAVRVELLLRWADEHRKAVAQSSPEEASP